MPVGDDETDPRLAFGRETVPAHAGVPTWQLTKDVRISFLERPVAASVELKEVGRRAAAVADFFGLMEISISAIALTFESRVARNWSMPTVL